MIFFRSDSIDCISLINEEYFLSGSNDGSLGIWCLAKKKPILTIKNAHKAEDANSLVTNGPDEHVDGLFNNTSLKTGWICSVRAYSNSDLLASGSDDGFIRIWEYTNSSNTLKEKFKIPVVIRFR